MVARAQRKLRRHGRRLTSRIGVRAPLTARVRASTSASMIRSAAKASISRTKSPSACFSTNSISAILSSVIVVSVSGSRSRNPNLLRRSAMTASVTNGRVLRYAGVSARGLLRHHPGRAAPMMKACDKRGHNPPYAVPAPGRGRQHFCPRFPALQRRAECGFFTSRPSTYKRQYVLT